MSRYAPPRVRLRGPFLAPSHEHLPVEGVLRSYDIIQDFSVLAD